MVEVGIIHIMTRWDTLTWYSRYVLDTAVVGFDKFVLYLYLSIKRVGVVDEV